MKPIQTCVLLSFLLFSTSCKSSEQEVVADIPANQAIPTFTDQNISTDKACYQPGEEVIFNISISSLPTGAKVRYKYLNNVVDEQAFTSGTWKWQTPSTDYRGYTAEVYAVSNNLETIYAVIGIDVSSDWKKFPRYGFLSKFNSVDDATINSVISNLSRYHINGIQFYDWQNKHHKPLPLNGTVPAENWKDIGNRDINFATVKNYIAAAHSKNMKAMFYDLVYGAWSNAEADGVKKKWYMYSDNTHTNIDLFSLSSPFISNLYFLDPANTEWQDYMKKQVNTVYQYLDFDGYHMDQVGDRGKRYHYDGSYLDLANSFGSYINAIKSADPAKYNVMNAVTQFGQQSIASASTDFLYSEVWTPTDTYGDLANIIKQNNAMSSNTKNSILAAYMNYELADNKGYFNTPSILMVNSVIFAFGGAHLELGEHMLCKEYFPNSNLSMKDDLTKSLVNYYDFMVAYQNLLRDGGAFNSINVESLDGKTVPSVWPASQGKVAYFGRKMDTKQVIHFINFTNSTIQQWRDNKGIQVMPAIIKDAKVALTTDVTVKKMWIASPDRIGGASQALSFVQNGNKVSFSLPELKYWDMVVVEY